MSIVCVKFFAVYVSHFLFIFRQKAYSCKNFNFIDQVYVLHVKLYLLCIKIIKYYFKIINKNQSFHYENLQYSLNYQKTSLYKQDKNMNVSSLMFKCLILVTVIALLRKYVHSKNPRLIFKYYLGWANQVFGILINIFVKHIPRYIDNLFM